MAQGWTTFREIAQIKRENMELSKQRMENMQSPCKECSIDKKSMSFKIGASEWERKRNREAYSKWENNCCCETICHRFNLERETKQIVTEVILIFLKY